LVRSAQQRPTAQADLHGPGRQLARQILAQAIRAAAERKAAAPRGPSTGSREVSVLARGPRAAQGRGAGGGPQDRPLLRDRSRGLCGTPESRR